jgi:hypothetical protein
LDEHEETLQNDDKVLIQILEEWVQLSCGSLKMCVSSREYNVFENVFAIEKRIRLQDLTRLDMERYACDRLKDINNGEQKDRLVAEIGKRSDGIFLWVALVVKVFREYIEDDKDITAFESILESLPDELELLCEHLLATVRNPDAGKSQPNLCADGLYQKAIRRTAILTLNHFFLRRLRTRPPIRDQS